MDILKKEKDARSAESALLRSEAQLRVTQFMVENAADAVFWVASTGNFVYVNTSAARQLGYTAEELLQKPLSDLNPDLSGERWSVHWNDLRKNREIRYDTAFRHRSGELIPFEVRGKYIEYNGKQYGCVFASDIRERVASKRERAMLLEREKYARQEAENANKAKDVFLAMVSHELRTPITTILSWSQLMRSGRPMDAKTQVRALSMIEDSAHSQAQMVNELLDIERIMTGEFSLDVQDVDVRTALESATDSLGFQAAQKNINMKFDSSAVPVMIRGDSLRLQQILQYWTPWTRNANFGTAECQHDIGDQVLRDFRGC
jgi:PAS domain S-box-containing protein